MRKTPVLFWAALVYLIATVTFNVATQWHGFANYHLLQKVGVASNLGLKIIAIALLLFRRREAIYLLALAFVIGLSVTAWDYYSLGGWAGLPLPNKVGRVFGFVVSLAIIVYLAGASEKGVLRGSRLQKAV